MQKSKIIRNTFYTQLAVFVALSTTVSIGQVIDGLIIGQCLGVDSIAAFGIISPLLIVFSLFGAIVSTGSRNNFTKCMGMGETQKAKRVFSLALFLSGGFGVLMLLCLLPLSVPVSRLLGASGNAAALLPKASAYLIGISIGLPAMSVMRVLNSFLPIDNDRVLPVAASIVLTVTDILLDLIVAFVLHGDTFEMGLATSLSYYAAVALQLLHFRRKDRFLRITFRKLPWRTSAEMVLQGLPSGVCRMGNVIRSAYMNRLLAVIASSAAIAAYSVHRQTDSFLNPIIIGMADTVALIAGVLLGEEDRPRMKRLLFTSVQANFLLTLGIAVLTWASAPWFAALYIKGDPEALRLSIRAVRAYAVGMPLYGLSLIYFNYFQGIGRNRLSAVAGFLSESGFLILSAQILSIWFGADAVWFAFPVTQVMMLLYYIIVIAMERRRLGLSGCSLWDQILLLPVSFDVPETDRMDRSISSMEEVMALSQDVTQFCKNHGCDARRTYYMALAVEELAGNVIRHGFSRDRKPHSMEIRVLKKGEEYILRIRDDCPIFDPVHQLTLYSDADLVHHIGLRMAIGSAKEVKYTCIFKLNNLVIRQAPPKMETATNRPNAGAQMQARC